MFPKSIYNLNVFGLNPEWPKSTINFLGKLKSLRCTVKSHFMHSNAYCTCLRVKTSSYPFLWFNLASDGRAWLEDCEEAVICSSLISPFSIPRAVVQAVETKSVYNLFITRKLKLDGQKRAWVSDRKHISSMKIQDQKQCFDDCAGLTFFKFSVCMDP